MKTDNFIDGRYLAELTKQVMEDLENSKYQMNELRISIYGRSIHEWDKVASWVIDNKLFSHNVRWLIQVPRLYDIYKRMEIFVHFWILSRIYLNHYLRFQEIRNRIPNYTSFCKSSWV